MKNGEKFAALVCGVLFLGVTAYAGLRSVPFASDQQFLLVRVVAAVAAAGFAAVIPGFLNVSIRAGTKLAIRAGGALAVFVVVYLLTPSGPPAIPRNVTINNSPDANVVQGSGNTIRK